MGLKHKPADDNFTGKDVKAIADATGNWKIGFLNNESLINPYFVLAVAVIVIFGLVVAAQFATPPK